MVKLSIIGTGGKNGLLSGQTVPGLTIKNNLGRGAGYGFARRGHGAYGDTNRVSGVYQRRRVGWREGVSDNPRKHSYSYTRMRYYRPTNPRTVEQQANRSKFTNAVEGWTLLTPVEKSVYNDRGKKLNRIGRNIFISEYMASAD